MLPEEEQLQLLGKMLLHSVNHLTPREREVYDQMVEALSKRIGRLHRLERQTERLKILPGEPDPDQGEPDQSKKHVVRNLRPEEVVRLFIDTWNQGAFDTEYYCLSKDCEKGQRKQSSFPEYIESRKVKWADRDLTGIQYKRMTEVSSSEMRGNRAVVHCIEVHNSRREEITLWREYQMVYEDGGWRIINFLTRKRQNKPLTSAPS